MPNRLPRLLLIFALSVAFFAQSAEGRKAEIVDPSLTRDSDLIAVGFRVEGAFSDSIVEAIQTGAPTTFTFLVELYRERRGRLDERILARTIERTVQYDTLKQHYIITENGEQETVGALSEAERLMTEVRQVPVAHVSSLRRGGTYYVRVKAELTEVKLPFVFSFLRFFVQLWDFETRWTRIDLPRFE